MKKLLVLLGIIILPCTSALASIGEYQTSDIDTLRYEGYSESMLQAVDTSKYHQTRGKSKRYFQSTSQTKSGKKLGRAYSYIKTYVDPAQDDGLFGEHQINFSNSWDWGKNNYSSRYKKVEQIDNL